MTYKDGLMIGCSEKYIPAQLKINVNIYIESRNGVTVFSTPYKGEKNIQKHSVYCIQMNQLCITVSTQQSVN